MFNIKYSGQVKINKTKLILLLKIFLNNFFERNPIMAFKTKKILNKNFSISFKAINYKLMYIPNDNEQSSFSKSTQK